MPAQREREDMPRSVRVNAQIVRVMCAYVRICRALRACSHTRFGTRVHDQIGWTVVDNARLPRPRW